MSTTSQKKLVVSINHDPDPLESEDYGWKLYSFNRRHGNFKHPRDLGLGPLDQCGDPKITNIGLRRKLDVGLAFILSYFEHGNCLWFRNGADYPAGVEFQWDGTRVAGLLVWEEKPGDIGAKTCVDRAEDADSFLKEYTARCNGEVYYFRIEDVDGEEFEPGGSYYDVKEMFEEISRVVAGHEVVKIKGDAKDLAEYYDIVKKEKKCHA